MARKVVERQQVLNGAELEVCLYTPVRPKSPTRQTSEQEEGIQTFINVKFLSVVLAHVPIPNKL